MSLLSDSEIQSLKEDVTEIKSDVKEVHNSVNALKILIIGKYVTKDEFEQHKKDEITDRRWWAGYIVSAATVITAMITLYK